MQAADRIRNVALVGHRGSGKTSLHEALLHEAERNGLGEAQLLPFHAELAFEAGRYHEIPGLLARLPEETRQRPPFAELVRSWNES